MRRAVISLALLCSVLALPNLVPPPSSSALTRRSALLQDRLSSLDRRHGDDEHEAEEPEHHHGMSEMDEENGKESSAQAEAVHMEHAHGGDEHHHGHGPALLVLNETQILLTHSPDPPSYYDFDQGEDGRPTVLYVHVFLMCVAYFGLLPLALFLKAGRSAISIVPQTAFLATSILGLIFGQAYNALTPNMYEHSSHTSWSWATVFLTIALNVLDVGRFVLRFTRWGDKLESQLSSWKLASTSSGDEEKTERSVFQLGEDEEDVEENERLVSSPVEMEHEIPDHPHPHLHRWGGHSPKRQFSRQSSALSDSDTVFDSAGPDSHLHHLHADERQISTAARLRRYGSMLFTFSERFLVIMAWIQVCTGVAVWTGTCRERYLNGCLAHIIKGSIFFFYGLLTFARYLGAFSSLGWAWNRHPSRNNSIWTAEFVESLVIFVYGSTNTWLERLGKTGAWSVKDVQHTSIAILFWAAGALGMLLESRSVRAWLSTSAAQASGRSLDQIPPPASASASFNVLPATCIGLIGVVMSAHHQTYKFQVDVHALWGYLLAAFAIFRWATYFFTFLRPPASILPSRPPTEALASIFLAAGGLVFIESTEQVTFAAMRHGWDDVMAFLTLTVSLVVFLFFWIAALFAVKGWALKRNAPASSSSLRAAHAKSTALA
ncbi:hypothetical protein JCM11251_005450 [Rhodosporidiobolus azoricus]